MKAVRLSVRKITEWSIGGVVNILGGGEGNEKKLRGKGERERERAALKIR